MVYESQLAPFPSICNKVLSCTPNFLQIMAEGRAGAEGENQPGNEENRAVENENVAEPGAANGGLNWWGVVKEIQMIVFGFITSLLPGFHNHMD